jgi:hypothetical protein
MLKIHLKSDPYKYKNKKRGMSIHDEHASLTNRLSPKFR